MRVERSLTIDEIYDRVQDYELVVTASEALADALNNRLTGPRIGKLAYTPRSLVAREFRTDELVGQRDLFLKSVHELDISWKEASFLLDEVTNYWKETGGLTGFLSSAGLTESPVSGVIDLVRSTNNVYGAMEDFRIGEGTEVCVVAPYQFSTLARSIFPGDADELTLFCDEKRALPPFRVFDSASQLVGATIDNVVRLDPEEVGIVVHPDSEYDPLIRSQLRGRGVPFQVAENAQESEALRSFVRFLRLKERGDRIKLRDVKPIAGAMGIEVPVEREEEYLEEAETGPMRALHELFEGTNGRTFAETLSYLQDRGLDVDSGTGKVLEDLRLREKSVNEENLNNLEYYLDSYPLERRRSASGVVLVDPRSSPFVDRSVVFYLGMTSRWDARVEEESWRDAAGARRRNRKNFKSLIQNGDELLYMVQDRKYNREVTPSTYFNELKGDFSSFSGGVKGEDYQRYSRIGPKRRRFSGGHVDEVPDRVTVISQSALNVLAYCPRDYFFSRIVEEPDRDYFRKGGLYHDFAEFYANFPGLVEEEGLSTFVELMVDRMRSIVDEVEISSLRTEFTIGVRAIRDFLREKKLGAVIDYDDHGYSASEGKNYFAEEFDRRLDRNFTEMGFADREVGIKGKVDMLAGSEIVDYKSGRKKSSSGVVADSNVDLVEEKPDFQALAYISHHRKVHGEEPIGFIFFHFLGDSEGSLRGKTSFRDNLTEVTYYPCTFKEFLRWDDVYTYAHKSNRKKLLDAMGADLFLDTLSRLEFEPGDFCRKDSALRHREQLLGLCRPHLRVGTGSDYDITEIQLDKAVTGILKTSLYELRTNNYFKEDVDEFERFVTDELEKLNLWREDRFPVGKSDLTDVEHRDLILAGEGI